MERILRYGRIDRSPPRIKGDQEHPNNKSASWKKFLIWLSIIDGIIKPLIFKVFCREDAEDILKIPISITRREDRNFWLGSTHGKYIVQSAYKGIRGEKWWIRMAESARTSFHMVNQQVWEVTWSLIIRHKIKLFVWKCMSEAVPVKELIWRRMQKGNPMCSACGGVETLEHLLLKCHKTKEIWKLACTYTVGLDRWTYRELQKIVVINYRSQT